MSAVMVHASHAYKNMGMAMEGISLILVLMAMLVMMATRVTMRLPMLKSLVWLNWGQFGDWSGASRLLSSACAQGIVVWVPNLKRTGISDTSLCECGQADKTPDHALQSCPKYAERCQLTWPQGADLATKLWGSAEDLYRTAGFVASTGLKIWPARLSIAEEEEEEDWIRESRQPSLDLLLLSRTPYLKATTPLTTDSQVYIIQGVAQSTSLQDKKWPGAMAMMATRDYHC